jgi:hypothetical protein
MNRAASILVVLAFGSLPSLARATTIDFNNFFDPTNVASFSVSGATFTGIGTTTGFEISSYGQTDFGTGGNILCPRTDAVYCGGDFQVSFTGLVSDLQFQVTGDDDIEPLSVQGFRSGQSLGTLTLITDGVNQLAQTFNLSPFGSLDKIVVTGGAADRRGLGYDNFSFQAIASGAVPEPATWAMMILGFSAIGFSMRRKQRQSIRYSFA